MVYVILFVLAALVLIPMAAFFVLTLAAVIFAWTKIFPFVRGIAEWITDRRNLLPFVLFMLIVIAATFVLLIGAYFFTVKVSSVGLLALLPLILILGIAWSIFWGGMGLAMIMWITRLSHWGYAHFRTRFERTSPPSGLPAYRSRRRLPARRPITNQPPPVPSTEEKANAKAEAKHKVKAKAEDEIEAYYRSEYQRFLAEAKAKAEVKTAKVEEKAEAEQKAKAKTKAEEEIEAYYESEYQRFLAEAKSKVEAKTAEARAQAEAEAKPEEEIEAYYESEFQRFLAEAKTAEARAQAEQIAEAKARPRLRRRRRLKQGK